MSESHTPTIAASLDQGIYDPGRFCVRERPWTSWEEALFTQEAWRGMRDLIAKRHSAMWALFKP